MKMFMRGPMITSLTFLLLTGCVSNNSLATSSMAEENVNGLAQICVGMSKGEVLKLMPHPERKESLERDGKKYDFWFYVTTPTALSQKKPIRHNLTPLAFENGVLKGWGFSFYDQALSEKSEEVKTQKSPKSLQRTIQDLEKQNPTSKLETKEEGQPLAMSKKPKKDPKEKDEEQKDPRAPTEDEGRKMKEEEDDQNFNFW